MSEENEVPKTPFEAKKGKGINIKIYTKRNSVKIVLSEEVLYVASRFAAGTLSFELNHTDTSKPVFQSQLLVHL